MTDLSKWDADQTLYLFTSLTAGSSHIITATSRIETILKANRIPFTYIDTATNEEAKKLYGRRASGRKLPLLVKEGFVVGDLMEIEEWNEFGELQDMIGPAPTVATSITTAPQNPDFKAPYGDTKAAAPIASSASSVASKKTEAEKENVPTISNEAQLAMARAGSEAASIASDKKKAPSIASVKTTQSTAPSEAQTSLADRTAAPRSSTESTPKPLFHEVSPIQQPADQRQTKSHRGSSVSAADDEVIKAIEAALAIPEEREQEAGTGQSVSASGTADAAPEREKDESIKSANTTAVEADKDAASIKSAATATTAPAAEKEAEKDAESIKSASTAAAPATEEKPVEKDAESVKSAATAAPPAAAAPVTTEKYTEKSVHEVTPWEEPEQAKVTEGQEKSEEDVVQTQKQKAGKGEQAGESVVD